MAAHWWSCGTELFSNWNVKEKKGEKNNLSESTWPCSGQDMQFKKDVAASLSLGLPMSFVGIWPQQKDGQECTHPTEVLCVCLIWKQSVAVQGFFSINVVITKTLSGRITQQTKTIIHRHISFEESTAQISEHTSIIVSCTSLHKLWVRTVQNKKGGEQLLIFSQL